MSRETTQDFENYQSVADSENAGSREIVTFADTETSSQRADTKGNSGSYELFDFQPTLRDFELEVLEGLQETPKRLSCKLLYDERGAVLFDEITVQTEYYPTRTELWILQNYAKEIASYIGEDAAMIELGSGNCQKVKILLDELTNLAVYIPVDIEKASLDGSAQSLLEVYPTLRVKAVCADYTQALELPEVVGKRVVFFPGSTFGNFEPAEAASFLKQIASLLKPGDGFLIGLDMKKDTTSLNQAYNDAAGVTAAFNLNLLTRINDELNANFKLELFEHVAFYNEVEGRIEMYLKSLSHQVVLVGDVPIFFTEGEMIHTENSYKFEIQSFHALAEQAGFEAAQVWTDPNGWFSVHYLEREG